MQRYHRFHVEAILAAAQLQLLSHSIHGSIFPQIHPVVKAILGNLYGIGLVGFDLADAEHRRYYLDMLNSNWWECVPYHKDDKYQSESWLTEGDGIWCAIAEAVDYLSMEG